MEHSETIRKNGTYNPIALQGSSKYNYNRNYFNDVHLTIMSEATCAIRHMRKKNNQIKNKYSSSYLCILYFFFFNGFFIFYFWTRDSDKKFFFFFNLHSELSSFIAAGTTMHSLKHSCVNQQQQQQKIKAPAALQSTRLYL